jgi:hypothetical protein
MADENDDIKVGDKVSYSHTDGPFLLKYCGPAVVIALDGEWPGDPPCLNRPSAWIRYTSPDGFYRYRSVDVCELAKEETPHMSDSNPWSTWTEPTMTDQWVWGVMAVQSWPDRPSIDLRRALDAGWEPFAVADGHIWLKKKEPK